MKLLVCLSLLVAISGEPTLWPWPKSATYGNQTLTILPSCGIFSIKLKTKPNTLTAALDRYCAIIFPHAVEENTGRTGYTTTSLEIHVRDLDESHPQLLTDESYLLQVPLEGPAVLFASTLYGALRGLETFSQLIHFDFNTKTYRLDHAPWTIKDAPRFPHRGLMIDTSRHFQPISSIKAMIQSLTYAKLNVLHWHMVDSQSFPFESKTFPKLWQGAYSEQEKYTQEDIRDVVEYARLRGVRVIVEFDMPGHARSWCKGYPEICPSRGCPEPLNVASNATFEVIDGLLKECSGGKKSSRGNPMGLFPDNFIHLGGDEVGTKCWDTTPTVSTWLADRGMDAHDGYLYFVKRAAAIAAKYGRRVIQWDEVFDNFKTELPKNSIVHVWKTQANITEIALAGYNMLLDLSGGDHSWYLDHIGVTWQQVYSFNLCEQVPTQQLCDSLVYGGHGEMWGENVDISDIQSTVWPKLAAVAERLWSASDVVDMDEAERRIRWFRCLLNRRGVAASPVSGQARAAPARPSGCLEQ